MSADGNIVNMHYHQDSKIKLERHASDLKRYIGNPDDVEEENEWDVAKIVDAKGTGDDRVYLVNWKNFPSEFDTWEPRENFNDPKLCDDADIEFPSKEQSDQASDIPVRAPDAWIQELQPSQIAQVVGVRQSRGGKSLEIVLKGKRNTPMNNRRIPIDQLPQIIRDLPIVKSFIT